jgi:hypothetical protein
MDRVDYESVVIQDLYNLSERDELNLNPWYQRRSVWTDTQKAYLINSVFENAPIPTCYVRHYLDVATEKSIKEVVDGQQRIRAVLSYMNDEFAAAKESGGKRLKFSQLSPADRQHFRMQKISVGYLINADDADVIDIFGRLNSVAKTLNYQEKRNATYSGSMKQFCLKQGAKYVTFWRSTKLFTSTSISRMDEVQFVSDITFNLVNGLSDFSQPKLNKFYAENDDEFDGMASIRKRFDAVMDQMLEHEAEITNPVFSRSPIFFSLFLILDSKKVTSKKLKEGIAAIDAAFAEVEDNDDGLNANDLEFYNSVIASTQRIKSREVRDGIPPISRTHS